MRLLLIEDNARLGSLVRDGLIPQGFAVDWVETVEDAELAMKVATYDLLLVDLGLPDGDGLDIVRRSRRDKNATPILVLTARGGLDDRVTGLDAGADDYLVKPFQIPELAARCRALLRRPGAALGTQLAAGMDPEESAARATGTAGSAVVFAGLTVVIALSGLAVVGIPFLTVMGVFAAIGVALAVVIALTMLPAFMGLMGERLRPWKSRRGRGSSSTRRARAPPGHSGSCS